MAEGIYLWKGIKKGKEPSCLETGEKNVLKLMNKYKAYTMHIDYRE